jgi:hypothetical protein
MELSILSVSLSSSAQSFRFLVCDRTPASGLEPDSQI